MRRASRRRVRLFLWFSFAGALIGVGYGALIGAMFRRTGLIGGAIGAIDGAAIAGPIAGIELFFLPTRWGRAVRQAPFLVTFGVKWLIYGTWISVINLRSPGVSALGLFSLAPPLPREVALLSVGFSFGAAFEVLFVFELSQIVGPRNLWHFLLGRYHQPRLEERFFLFIDIQGSTPLAEQIGPVAVHRFLGRVFALASDPIGDHRGEIYQYVGDEMVVTWTLGEGHRNARPIACFFSIVAAVERAAAEFEREFGVVPRLRAALHAGPVISGEIGESKRDIVFHGDVMNTAARLEQATRDLNRQFLVSADALHRLEGMDRHGVEPLGLQPLRGRQAPVDVCAITSVTRGARGSEGAYRKS